MKRSATWKALLGFAVLGLFAQAASAEMMARLQRFAQRDPLAFTQDVFAPAQHYRGGLNLHGYASSNPLNETDANALNPCRKGVPYDEEVLCCACLAFAEDRGHPECLALTIAVMCNRQATGWPDFRGEDSFCDQAELTGRWAGGVGNSNYDRCCKCPPTGSDGDEINQALSECRAGCPQPLYDPTLGAQFVVKCGTEPHWLRNDPDCRQTISCGGDCYWYCSSQPDGH